MYACIGRRVYFWLKFCCILYKTLVIYWKVWTVGIYGCLWNSLLWIERLSYIKMYSIKSTHFFIFTLHTELTVQKRTVAFSKHFAICGTLFFASWKNWQPTNLPWLCKGPCGEILQGIKYLSSACKLSQQSLCMHSHAIKQWRIHSAKLEKNIVISYCELYLRSSGIYAILWLWSVSYFCLFCFNSRCAGDNLLNLEKYTSIALILTWCVKCGNAIVCLSVMLVMQFMAQS